MIVAFAVIAAALAGVPGARQERQVYSTYSNVVGAPLAYAASPYAAYPAYSGVPTAYAGYPYGSGVYGAYGANVYSAPTVQYY